MCCWSDRRSPSIVDGLTRAFNVPKFADAKDQDKFFAETAPRIRAIACSATSEKIAGDADGDAFRSSRSCRPSASATTTWTSSGRRRTASSLTNTPEVLTEEVADTALGLLLCTVREFPQAERYLRAGKWRQKDYPLSKASLRNRTVGLVGMGRDRPGDRAPARRHAGAGGVSHAASGGGRGLPALSEASRHGARRRRAARHHAGRRRDAQHDQCRGARGARARRAS